MPITNNRGQNLTARALTAQSRALLARYATRSTGFPLLCVNPALQVRFAALIDSSRRSGGIACMPPGMASSDYPHIPNVDLDNGHCIVAGHGIDLDVGIGATDVVAGVVFLMRARDPEGRYVLWLRHEGGGYYDDSLDYGLEQLQAHGCDLRSLEVFAVGGMADRPRSGPSRSENRVLYESLTDFQTQHPDARVVAAAPLLPYENDELPSAGNLPQLSSTVILTPTKVWVATGVLGPSLGRLIS